MSYMFAECKSLEEVPDLSKWNTENVKEMKDMFIYCDNLEEIPNINIPAIHGNVINVAALKNQIYY